MAIEMVECSGDEIKTCPFTKAQKDQLMGLVTNGGVKVPRWGIPILVGVLFGMGATLVANQVALARLSTGVEYVQKQLDKIDRSVERFQLLGGGLSDD